MFPAAALIFQLITFWLAPRIALPAVAAPQEAAPVEIIPAEPLVDFEAQSITFQFQVRNLPPDTIAYIYLEPEGRAADYFPVTLAPDGSGVYVLDLRTDPVRVFTQINYAYRLELADGTELDSPPYQTQYADNRFAWKSLKDESFEIYFYERAVDFGQTALNVAEQGMEEAYSLVPVRPAGVIRIYIYRDPTDLQKAQQGLQPWAVGHAAPDLRMALVSIPSGPEQLIELERQLPHELVHILQYQVLKERARGLPVWLLEGSASVAELYQNPEYASVIQSSIKQNRLLNFETLCAAFPRDASGAFLAYAQSQSFVAYLRDKYGASTLQALYQKYADGMSCTAGFEAAYGATLPEIEYRWQLEALGVNAAALIARNLLPYLLVFLLLFGAAAASILLTARRRRAQSPA